MRSADHLNRYGNGISIGIDRGRVIGLVGRHVVVDTDRRCLVAIDLDGILDPFRVESDVLVRHRGELVLLRQRTVKPADKRFSLPHGRRRCYNGSVIILNDRFDRTAAVRYERNRMPMDLPVRIIRQITAGSRWNGNCRFRRISVRAGPTKESVIRSFQGVERKRIAESRVRRNYRYICFSAGRRGGDCTRHTKSKRNTTASVCARGYVVQRSCRYGICDAEIAPVSAIIIVSQLCFAAVIEISVTIATSSRINRNVSADKGYKCVILITRCA